MGLMAAKILIVDDDKAVLRTLVKALTLSSFSVVSADNGAEALIMARESLPDLILFDVEMPGLDGHSLCRALRAQTATKNVPLIMMSGARKEEKDVLTGFEGGADDYVFKPFSHKILIKKIEALLRRAGGGNTSQADQVISCGGIELDPGGRTAKTPAGALSLTPKEFDLLALLLSKPGRVLSPIYLLETVWGYDPADYNDPHTVEVHISQLRRKLGPKLGKLIVSMTGHGYKFVA